MFRSLFNISREDFMMARGFLTSWAIIMENFPTSANASCLLSFFCALRRSWRLFSMESSISLKERASRLVSGIVPMGARRERFPWETCLATSARETTGSTNERDMRKKIRTEATARPNESSIKRCAMVAVRSFTPSRVYLILTRPISPLFLLPAISSRSVSSVLLWLKYTFFSMVKNVPLVFRVCWARRVLCLFSISTPMISFSLRTLFARAFNSAPSSMRIPNSALAARCSAM